MASESESDAVKGTKVVAAAAQKRAKRATKGKAKRKPKAAKTRLSPKAPAKSASKPKAGRKFTAPAERAKIIAAAQAKGLTALEVQKRFGVKPVTYYSWRKKLGLKGQRGRRPAVAVNPPTGDLSAQVRAGVQARVRELLPSIVREEVASYLDTVLASSKSAKRRPGTRGKK